MHEEFRIIAQRYIGMTPKDMGCETWSEMQQQMADVLENVVKNISSKHMLCDKNCTKKCSCGAELHQHFHCNICDNDA